MCAVQCSSCESQAQCVLSTRRVTPAHSCSLVLRICAADMQIPKQVMNYTANSKAVDKDGGGYQLMLGTRAFKLDRMLLSRLQRWEISRGGMQEWRDSCKRDCNLVKQMADKATDTWQKDSTVPKGEDPGKVVKKYLRDEGPSFLISNLASGNTLVASNAFKATLKQLDRKMTACKTARAPRAPSPPANPAATVAATPVQWSNPTPSPRCHKCFVTHPSCCCHR